VFLLSEKSFCGPLVSISLVVIKQVDNESNSVLVASLATTSNFLVLWNVKVNDLESVLNKC
jgi:hypothetical protein